MELALIIKEIRKSLNLSQEELAGGLGIKRSNLSQMENGRNNPSVTILNRIANIYGIDIQVVFEMINAAEDRLPELSARLRGGSTPEDAGRGKKDLSPALLSESSPGSTIRVPVVEIDVAAGAGSYNPDYLNEIDAIFIPESLLKGRKKQQYLAVRIRGESMSPTLLNKGLLIIHCLERTEWRDIQDGGIYVVVDREGRSYVKRLRNRLGQGYLLLSSDNPDKLQYGDFTLDEADIHAVWQADGYLTTYMPDIHQQYYHRLTDLEADINQMKSQIRQLATSIEKNSIEKNSIEKK